MSETVTETRLEDEDDSPSRLKRIERKEKKRGTIHYSLTGSGTGAGT